MTKLSKEDIFLTAQSEARRKTRRVHARDLRDWANYNDPGLSDLLRWTLLAASMFLDDEQDAIDRFCSDDHGHDIDVSGTR
jgi:hypothetical protein